MNTSSKGGPEQRAPAPSSTLFGGATGLATQERLSQHLDKVEIKLVGEIGARSESFFEASARLHELDAIVSETCGAIRRTRRSLLEASTYATCAHESVTSLHRKRANLRTLTHVFEALSSVRECREDLDVLVAAEDCGGALEVCEEIRRKVSDPTLAGLACLKDVAAHVDGVENQVASALVLEFTRAARVQPGSVGHPGDETGEFGTDGLSSEPNSRRRVSPGDGWGPATTRAALAEVRAAARDAGMENVLSASEEDEEDDVSPSDQDVVGLGPSEESSADVFDAALPPLRALIRGGAHRTGRIGDAMRAWGRDAASDARACIRRACLASLRVADSTVLGVQSVDMDGSNYSANSVSTEKATYKAMETLPAEVFAAVIRAATHALAGHFARAEIVRSAAQYALGTVAKDGGENTSRGIVADDVRTQLCASLPPGERASASAAASDAVLALADASQGAMAKILASRASTNARLTLREFSKICDAAESFLARAESLSGGRRCLSLRGALNTQCKDFMSVRHAAHAAKLGSVLESETWTAVAPVPGEYQRILDAGFEPCVAVNSAERGAEGGADTAVHDDDDTAVRDALVLPGGERVVPVGASLALLKMCADHLAVARRVPSLGPVAVYKIAELLRVFNSRTSQLVLGAGSMRTAGLRSITAKHLALAQQSVRLFLEVTPAVSAALSPTLPDTRRTQLLSEFTSTVRDLEKHKTELQTKMVSIARDRLVYHSARLPTIWCSHIFTARKASSEEGAADLAEASSEFATALGKEVGTLRRVIAGTLSNEDATCVLNEVLRVFDEGLTAALAGSKESTANEWRAKMGSPTKPKPAVPMDDAEGGAEEGADTAVVHDDDGEETEETTVKSAAPSENEVNGLIGRDGGALLGTLGTLVNGGTGGDGACGAPTLAKYLLEYRS
jgi:vacuolar protein sorting-associated protein 54